LPINAQQQKRIPRIGYLSSLSLADEAVGVESFKRGLRALGRVDGQNVLIEYRFAQRNFRRLLGLAAELVRLNVDLIVTAGPTPTRVARAATSTIPIVMAQDSDPVGNGFVVSLKRPGGNITGLSKMPPVISDKQLTLLKEISPKLSRVAVLGNSINPRDAHAWKETHAAARAFDIHLQQVDLRGSNDFESIFEEAIDGSADALLVLQSPITFSRRSQIAELAAKNRMPAIYPAAEFVEAGGLITYSVSEADLFRRAATYVDNILKGARAADLAVQQPAKFELIVNLKAAKQIGLTIPRKVLARADRVIR
jgi:putative ABC transport system substrate-binding protein